MKQKKCFKCGETKPLTEFYKHKQMADGHLNKCKTCAKSDVKNHRADNLEKVRAYDRSRGMLPHRVEARKEYAKNHKQEISEYKKQYAIDNKDHISEYKKQYAKRDYVKKKNAENQKRYRDRYPEKYKAHSCLGNAIRDGKLKRPNKCEMCGIECVPHAHHWSYKEEHWLDVEWLCVVCHMQLHHSR